MSEGISRRGWLSGVFGGLVAWFTAGSKTAKTAFPEKLGPNQVCFYTKQGGQLTPHVHELPSDTIAIGSTTTFVYSAEGEFLHIKKEMPGPANGSDSEKAG
jgi:hypothetical protein